MTRQPLVQDAAGALMLSGLAVRLRQMHEDPAARITGVQSFQL